MGLRSSGGTRTSPEASAISTTAVRSSPRTPNRADTFSPRGPVTSLMMKLPTVPDTRVSIRPSPPSDSGIDMTSAVGSTRWIPPAIKEATSEAVRLSLNESGATNIRIMD